MYRVSHYIPARNAIWRVARTPIGSGVYLHVQCQESFSQNRNREFPPLRDGVGDGDRDGDRDCGGDNFDEGFGFEDGTSRYCGGGPSPLPRRTSMSMTSPLSSLATAGAHALSDIRTVRWSPRDVFIDTVNAIRSLSTCPSSSGNSFLATSSASCLISGWHQGLFGNWVGLTSYVAAGATYTYFDPRRYVMRSGGMIGAERCIVMFQECVMRPIICNLASLYTKLVHGPGA